MKNWFSSLLLMLCLAGFSGCSTMPKASAPPQPSYWIDEPALAETSPGDTRIEISISEQKVRLFGKNNRLLIESDASTGDFDKPTPPGKYRILERLPTKFSNLYGQYVDEETGEVVVARSWEHEGPPPEGTVYQGTEMPYWLRLTWSGIGQHVGEFQPGQRSSMGCIRVPEAVQPKIYHVTRIGTPVRIFQ